MTASPTSPEFRRLALLREFKLRRLRRGGDNLSPFADRIATAHGDRGLIDLGELHAEVRDSIVQQLAAVRTHQRSQVVLLSGDAGTGKSHILRHFARPAVADQHGYVFVGGSNDWNADEFQPCLLDWMITALTAPAPSEEHMLLDRVRAVGFRAVGQLLENRTALRRCTAKGRRRMFGLRGGRRASYETIERLARARDPGVFELLDFTKFGEEVCARFLAEPSNPVHRYALRVLLTYLFPDAAETGVGARDRVLNWFRRRSDDGYWVKRLGVGDDLNRRYAVADAIKLLVHLFSPDLSSRLSVPGDEHRPQTFLLVFDQVEGRDELFERGEDWNRFFAHLSELYNTLPNVLVLFTMTLHKRNELHPRMERQFKDRIRKDERFVLRQPTPAEVQALYRARLAGWLADDPAHHGAFAALPEAEKCLPFTPDEVVTIGGTRSVRDALEAFEPAFEKALKDLVIEPGYDFEYVLQEQQAELESVAAHDYTSDHLSTASALLTALADEFAAEFDGVRLNEVGEEWADGVRTLKFTFADPGAPSAWVRASVAHFKKNYRAQIFACAELLKNKQRDCNFVWMVRAAEFPDESARPDQMFGRVVDPQTEARLRAAKHLLDKRAEYVRSGTWPDARQVIGTEVRKSYLGELLAHARDRVNARKAGTAADEPIASDTGAQT